MTQIPFIYLDWNVFNKLEHLADIPIEEQHIYSKIEKLVLNKQLIAPYSNAHISDLRRGYEKNPSYTPKHLENIVRITNTFCVVQYWGEKEVRWHYRDPEEFLQSSIAENNGAGNFNSLLYFEAIPGSKELWDMNCRVLEGTPIPEKFKDLYKENPIFGMLFPRTKIEMNALALCEDIYSFSNKIKTDFVLYKNFRKYLTVVQQKYPVAVHLMKTTKKITETPKSLNWNELLDQHAPAHKTSANPAYDRIVNLFTTTDIKGYRPDEKFANLIDDALHAFYAAHCKYFISLDSRCADKAKKVYTKLGIATKVFHPAEFLEWTNKSESNPDNY